MIVIIVDIYLLTCTNSVNIEIFVFLRRYRLFSGKFNLVVFISPVIGWEFNRSRNATDYVLPEDVTTLLTTSVCSRDYPPHVLLIVCSSIENFALRTAIRETWAAMAFETFNISVAFLMGVSQDGQIDVSTFCSVP